MQTCKAQALGENNRQHLGILLVWDDTAARCCLALRFPFEPGPQGPETTEESPYHYSSGASKAHVTSVLGPPGAHISKASWASIYV